MRVLQLVTRRQHRGAEVFAAHLSNALAERGHEVYFVGLYPPPPEPLAPAGAKTADLQAEPGGRGVSLARLSQLASCVRSLEPDVVQANGSDTLKYSVLVKRLQRGRWPLVYRNISVASYWLRYPGQRAWGRWLARGVDHVVAVSDESRADFARTYSVAPSRISTIRRGVHLPGRDGAAEARENLRALADLPAEAEILVHIGSFTTEKNHLWLLEVFKQIRRRRERSHLLLLGDGPLRKTVAQAVADGGLEQTVHLLGSRADADELVAGADLLLLCSTVEGIPGVILEAAARGVPSVSTAVGGVHEAVRDGETGVLVASGDTAGFVSAVVELLDDPRQRQQLGMAAHDFVRRHHDMEAVVGAFEGLYQDLARAART